jgi:hypothetical protein
MKGWQVVANVAVDPLPADWRDQLAKRLGERPRRLGSWTELALFGALRCLDAAGETALPPGALLRVASMTGPRQATEALIAQSASTGLPMPFSFMQSQPSQMLSALAKPLNWSGDARFVLARDPASLLALARRESGPDGVLIGWVEEDKATSWWRLLPAAN